MKNAFRFITVSLAIVALAACSQQTSAPVGGTANDSLVLGMGEIPMGVGEGIDTQALDTVFNSVDPSDGAGIDFTVDSPSDIVFDDVSNVNYIRTRVRVTNNTGGNVTNLTLMAIAPRATTITALSRLRNLVGDPLSQLEAFNADTVMDPTAVDVSFIPSPTHAVAINDTGEVEIIETRADFVAYEEDPTAGTNRVGTNELTPIITELNNLAANTPAFGLTGVEGTDFSLLPYGFQVGSLADGAQGFVDVTFSIPNDPDGIGVSPLARFGYTFVAVQDTEGRVTQAVEEIEIVNAPLDSGVGDVETRFLNPAAAQSNLQNVTSMALLGSAERDVSVPQTSTVCIPDVRVAFGVTASIFDTTQNEAATAGECVLNDASAFALAGDPQSFEATPQAGEALTDGSTPGEAYTLTLTDSGNPVEGRVVEAVITSAPTGVDMAFDAGTTSLTTDASGQVAFGDLVLNNVGAYTIEFRSGALLPVTENITVVAGPLSEFVLTYTSAAGATDADAVFPGTFRSVDTVTGDADPNATGIQAGALLAIRGVDQFGNEADIASLGAAGTAARQYLVDVVLLQNGTPVANNPIFGADNAAPPVNVVSDPYPEQDNTVTPAVNPVSIEFPTAATTGTFVFDGTGNTLAGTTPDKAADNQTTGMQFRVEEAGSNYQIQISIAKTQADLGSNPISVITTPEFTIEATVGSLEIVNQPLSPIPAGVGLTGVVAGQQMQVRVLDTTGAIMPNETVAATVAACVDNSVVANQNNGGAAAGAATDSADPDAFGNYLPIPAGDLTYDNTNGSGGAATGAPAAPAPVVGVYCTFANGTERGGLFIAGDGATDSTGADANETGVRIITATTNALGVATFSTANNNALTFSEPGGDPGTAGDGYFVAFTAGYDADGINGVTAFTNEFDVIASELASLQIDNDGDVTTAPAAQPFTTTAAGILQGTAAADIFINPLDKFGNILDVATPVTIEAVTPSANAVYGDDGGTLEIAAAARTLTAGTGVPASASASVQFAGGAADFYVAAAGADEAALATAAVPAGANAATGDSFRVRFSVVGTAISVTSNTFDPTNP